PGPTRGIIRPTDRNPATRHHLDRILFKAAALERDLAHDQIGKAIVIEIDDYLSVAANRLASWRVNDLGACRFGKGQHAYSGSSGGEGVNGKLAMQRRRKLRTLARWCCPHHGMDCSFWKRTTLCAGSQLASIAQMNNRGDLRPSNAH